MDEVDRLKALAEQVEKGQMTVLAAILEAYRFGQDVGLDMSRGKFPRSGMSISANIPGTGPVLLRDGPGSSQDQVSSAVVHQDPSIVKGDQY